MRGVCSPCNVGLHDSCLVYANAGASCICLNEMHTTFEHPGLHGRVFRKDYWSPQTTDQPVREVDYELEPFEQHPAGTTKANQDKPADDLEDARAAQRYYEARQAFYPF